MSARPFVPALGAGARLIGRHPGLVAALYAVQLALSVLAGFVVARALASAFAHEPLFDRAADGDLLAIFTVLREHPAVFAGAAWACLGFVVAYAMLSWFTTAGLLATAATRPTGARATAEAFGAGGAANVLAFARLTAWTLIPHALIAFVALLGLGVALGDAAGTDGLGRLVGRALAGLSPALAMWWITNTAVDFARIDLVTRSRKSALMALLRGYARVFTDWRPLALVGSFAAVTILVTGLYVASTAGVEMSWLALLLLRQVVAIARFLAKVCLLGAEVAIAVPVFDATAQESPSPTATL